jgi:hypothetical protein
MHEDGQKSGPVRLATNPATDARPAPFPWISQNDFATAGTKRLENVLK